MATRVSNTGTVSQSLGDDASVQLNPSNQSVGIGANFGEVRAGLGVNAQGQGNAGVSTQTGEGNVGFGVNSSGTVGAQYQSDLGGDVQFGVGVGYNVYGGGVGVTPTVTIGDSEQAKTGSQVGAAAGAAVGTAILPGIGTAVGSFLGSAAGSVIGDQFRDSVNQREKNKRDSVINRLKDQGFVGEDYIWHNPDGSTFDLSDEKTTRPWARKLSDDAPDLTPYQIDFSNDPDYTAGMMGITLARIMGGGITKHIDQTGNRFGNAFLGSVGYGNVLTPETFATISTNARAAYAKSGIKSKEDMLALANQMFADGRINDTDYAVMNQTAGLVYDNNFSAAQSLMGGRWRGVGLAASTPSGGSAGSGNSGGNPRVHSPFISGEEAQASVQSLLDIHRRGVERNGLNRPSRGLRNAASLAQAAGLVSSAAGVYRGINQATNGALNQYVNDGLQGLREALGLGNETPQDQSAIQGNGGGSGGAEFGLDGEISPGEYDLDSSGALDYGSADYSSDYTLSDQDLTF